MKCDICGTELDHGQGTIVPIEEIRQLASNGFAPKKLGIATSMDNVAAGILTNEQMDDAWRRLVNTDAKDWLLCETCHQITRPFALPAPSIVCLRCRNQNHPAAEFCGHCGNKLGVPEGTFGASKPIAFTLDSYVCARTGDCVYVFDSEQRVTAFHRVKSWNPNIQIFADEGETTLLMCIVARGISSLTKMFYDVTQPDGQSIGVLAHNEWRGFWLILTNSNQEVGKIEKPRGSVRTIRALDRNPMATISALTKGGGLNCLTQLNPEIDRVIDRRLVLAYSILSPLLHPLTS